MTSKYDVASEEARRGRRGLLDSGPHRRDRDEPVYGPGTGFEGMTPAEVEEKGRMHMEDVAAEVDTLLDLDQDDLMSRPSGADQ